MELYGYDFDGVITAGVTPHRSGVIITGRSYEEAPEINDYLKGRGIFNPVYYCPVKFSEKTHEKSAEWKATMIKLLGVTKFFEDEIKQAEHIMRETFDIERQRHAVDVLDPLTLEGAEILAKISER